MACCVLTEKKHAVIELLKESTPTVPLHALHDRESNIQHIMVNLACSKARHIVLCEPMLRLELGSDLCLCSREEDQ